MRSKRARSSSKIRLLLVVVVLLCGGAAFALSTELLSFENVLGVVSQAAQRSIQKADTDTSEKLQGTEKLDSAKAVGGANDAFVFGQGDLPLLFSQRIDKIYSLAPGGSPQELSASNDFEPSWSPDGRKIVFVSKREDVANLDSNRSIYKMNADGTDQERVNSGGFIGGEAQPSFSYHTNPTQQKIVYVADYSPSGQPQGLYTITGSGSPVYLNTEECFEEEAPKGLGSRRSRAGGELTPGIFGFDTPNFSPDNQYIIFGYPTGDTDGNDIYRIGADGSNCTRIYQGEDISFVATTARYSRDGTKIAFYATENDGESHKLKIIDSTTGALIQEFEPTNFFGSPVWSPNPGENKIAYVGGNQNPENPIQNLDIWTIDLTTGTEEQIYFQGVPDGIRGMDWGIPSTVVPQLSMRINQPHPLQGGKSTTGTLYLSAPAPVGGTTITLLAGNPVGQTIISLPSTSILIPEGQTQANFQIDAPVRSPNDHRTIDIFASRTSPAASAKASVSVWPTRSDLKANTFTAPASVAPAATFPISYSVQNIGPVATFGTGTVGGYDRVYFSADDQISAEDYMVRSVEVSSALGPGATRSVSGAQVSIPAAQTPSAGQYYLIFKTNAHPTETVYESDYTNNTIALPITIELPDLVPEDLVLPAVIQPGVNYSVTWTTRNIGTIASVATSSRLYYSPDPTFGDANDLLLATETTNALAPNATQNHSRTINIPTVPARSDGPAYFQVRTDYNNVVYEGLATGPGENNNTINANTSFEYRVADLQVTASGAPPEIETETSFAFNWTTANAGNKQAGTFDDRVYFSLDNQVGSDLLLGTFPLSGGLAAGGSVDRIQNLTIPTSAIPASGNYYLYILTDADTDVDEGENENNNRRFHQVNVRRLLRPDLVVSNITAPPTAFFDQTVQVQWTVTNNGQGPTNAPQWSDRLYLGTSSTSTSGASILATTQNISALNPGESYTASATVKIPRGFNGSYHFHVATNYNGTLNEENTTNNRLSRPITVNVPPLPDLIVETVQAPDEVFAGQEISINYTIKNIGNEDVGSRKDRIYFSRDTTLNTSQDRLVFTSDSIGGPLAGQSTSHVSHNRIGTQLPPVYQLARVPANMEGLWYVFVVTDYLNDVYEFTGENNNVNHDSVEPGSPINVLVTPPDLVVPNQPTAPATVAGGTQVPVSFMVKNQGAFYASANLYHAVYLSGDNILDSNDPAIGSIRDTNSFTPGAEHPFTINVSLPNCLVNGTYYLFAVADYDGRQFEFDPGFDAEANNTSPARPIELFTVTPDLQVTNIQIPPITTPGQSVSLNWTVSNLGGAVARNWYDRVYLRSTNPEISPVHLGSFEHTGGLAAGGSYTESRTVTLPAFMEGEYYVSVTTDSGTSVYECGAAENNNSANSGNFAVQNNLPDLVIDSVNAPAAAVVGDSFTVQWVGRNANQQMQPTSTSWRDYVYLSSNPTLGSDYYLGSVVNETPLGANQTYPQQLVVQTGNVPAGTYYILVRSDGGRNIYEGSSNSIYENNNVTASGTITLGTPDIDLSVGGVAVSLPHHSGTYRDISWTVTNNGPSPTLASAWSDYIILSRDSVIDNADITLGYKIHNTPLAGGANYTETARLLIPSGLTGDYRVFVITDKGNTVIETSNTNNTSVPLTINLTLPPPAELNITNITPPPSASPGGSATFTWTVQNTGANDVNGKWKDTVYLSRDQFWDASDVLVGTRDLDSQTTSAPAGGGTYTTSAAVTLPPVEEGTYYVIVRTDAQNRIRETNEGNNVSTSVGTTTVTITELQLNTPFNTTLTNGGQQFFKYTTSPAETLIFTLGTDIPSRSNELFTNFGTVVSRADYDFQGSRPGEGNQENVIPDTQDGKYFSMVRTDYIPESFAKNFEKAPPKNDGDKTGIGNTVTPQNITVEAAVLPYSIRSVSPEIAGNTGFTTLEIKGAKFEQGATVKLVGPTGTELTPIMFRVASAKIAALFELKNKAPGDYDVIVTNPGGAVATLTDGLEIIAGGGHRLSESIRGRQSFRIGAGGRSRYTLSARNEGTSDALFVPFIIDIPQINYELDPQNIPDLPASALPPGMTLPLPVHYDIGNRRVIILMIPILRAGTTMNFGIDLQIPSTQGSFTINSVTLPPLAEMFAAGFAQTAGGANRSALRAPDGVSVEKVDCWAEFTRMAAFFILGELMGELDGIDDCAKIALGLMTTVSDAITGTVLSHITGSQADGVGVAFTFSGVMANFASRIGDFPTLVDCVQTAENAFPPWKVVSMMISLTQLLYQAYQCLEPIGDEFEVLGYLSVDPNEKIGPVGYGAEHYVPLKPPLLYRINFENLATATAPAQRIFITDELPPTLDPRTVRLKEIGFKQQRIVVGNDQAFYQDRIQLGEDLNNLQADIIAGLDLVNRRVFWTIQAIDPQTGDAPIDPLLGILPPNNGSADGEGYVTFTVEPTAMLPTGTQLANRATIIFDENEAIVTNTTANLLDGGLPVSTIAPLLQTSSVLEIDLSWSGNDDPTGSGVRGYDILFSENGDAYSPYLLNSPEQAAVFIGKWGKSYRFYSVARDNAGNGELPPTLPDAEITILGGDTEGDVAPRPNGNDGQVASDDLTQVRRFIAGLDAAFQYNEFQRADTAPRDEGGNGGLTASDIVQARRYEAGLDIPAEAVGPNEAAPFSPRAVAGKKSSAAGLTRELRPVKLGRVGNKVQVAVELEAQGDEVAAGFTLNFSTSDLSNPTNIQLGNGAGTAVLTVNDTQVAQGQLGITFDKAPNDPIPAGTRQLITLEFDIAASQPSSTVLSFGNVPVFDEVANGLAAPLQTTFSPATISLVGPTAANVSVSGRVSNGTKGISNATVYLTDQKGRVRQARTSTFGYFRFDGIPAGQTYIVSVGAKRFRFSPRVISVEDAITDLEITPD